MPGGSFTALAIGKSGLGNRNRKYRGPERLDKKKRPGPSALHGSSGLKALIGASKKALNNERATYRIKRVSEETWHRSSSTEHASTHTVDEALPGEGLFSPGNRMPPSSPGRFVPPAKPFSPPPDDPFQPMR
jgi:hypothetical protein